MTCNASISSYHLDICHDCSSIFFKMHCSGSECKAFLDCHKSGTQLFFSPLKCKCMSIYWFVGFILSHDFADKSGLMLERGM